LWNVNPKDNDVATEAEEPSLLEAVARERLVKTTGWKKLGGCVVICEVCRLAIALQLLVVLSGVCKWSVNPFTNANPVYGHILRDNIFT
jgi:hypothetical protein